MKRILQLILTLLTNTSIFVLGRLDKSRIAGLGVDQNDGTESGLALHAPLEVETGLLEGYSKAKMARLHLDEMSAAGFSFIGPASPTFFLYGLYSDSGGRKTQRQSTIDHVYAAGLSSPTVTVEDFAATDHRPVKVIIPHIIDPPSPTTIKRRNIKHLSSATLCSALNITNLRLHLCRMMLI